MPSAPTYRVVAARRWLRLGWVQTSMSTAVVRPRRGWLGPTRKSISMFARLTGGYLRY
jgi:hypothetical protein